MRTIIAGSRSVTNMAYLLEAVNRCGFNITEVICGGAKGADALGAEWASDHNIPVIMMLAEWEKYGKKAGHIRNRDMAVSADAAILLWDGESPGTKSMATIARALGIPTYIQSTY